jgi:hypothetical protein
MRGIVFTDYDGQRAYIGGTHESDTSMHSVTYSRVKKVSIGLFEGTARMLAFLYLTPTN